ncbi:hypothetical protein Psta_0259 [Pirellula staleyi DSM 6068]|uniref:Uncharacterized protein n=1 Tax=Pirellula staleyi (strain ATCC 27377 / DSM 6068 / ICPB 4128) TaxID=530564 RepID=D2R1G9_PIRSD|nr:hypothetical protein [Pirellula staleyi]ADB14954.1 hypothetical protein Psta_0259 [Pirellula staleyi DSM 6068]
MLEQIDRLERVCECARKLAFGLEQLLPLLAKNPRSSAPLIDHLSRDARSLRDSMNGLEFKFDSPPYEVLQTIGRTLDLLATLGYTRSNDFGDMPTQPFPTKAMDSFSREVSRLSSVIETERELLQSQNDAAEVIEAGHFLEWVRRCPGRGAKRELGTFRMKRKPSGNRDYCSSQLFEYADDLWVSKEEEFYEDSYRPDGQEVVKVVNEAYAARVVLDSDVQLSSDLLLWASKKAGPPIPDDEPAVAVDRPSWNSRSRELSYKGQVVRRLATTATRAAQLVEAFENAGWPYEIDRPFRDNSHDGEQLSNVRKTQLDQVAKEKLRTAVDSLNDKLTSIRFQTSKAGNSVGWLELPTKPQFPPPPVDDVPF